MSFRRTVRRQCYSTHGRHTVFSYFLFLLWYARSERDASSLNLVLDITVAIDYIVYYVSAVLSQLLHRSVCWGMWTFCDVSSVHPASRVSGCALGLYGDILARTFLNCSYHKPYIKWLYSLDKNQNQSPGYDRYDDISCCFIYISKLCCQPNYCLIKHLMLIWCLAVTTGTAQSRLQLRIICKMCPDIPGRLAPVLPIAGITWMPPRSSRLSLPWPVMPLAR